MQVNCGRRQVRTAIYEISEIHTPLRDDQGSFRVDWISMVVGFCEMADRAVRLANRPDERRLPIESGDGEDVGAPGLERPRHLGEPSRGVQNMLKHILGDHHIEGSVRKGLLFQVLTSVSVLDASRGDIRIPMGLDAPPAFPRQLCR